MNLRSIDLNLLVILDALLDEAHVSRAAARLNLTQPAVSAALHRCRALFADELLQRGRGIMRRTPRAEALRSPLKTLLAGVHDLVDPPEIPLHAIRQSIRFIVTDLVAALLVPPLLRNLAREAPGIDLVMQPWQGGARATERLLRGESDLALSIFDVDVPGLERRLVLEESWTVVTRRDHPALSSFDLDRWLTHPHIVVSGQGERHTTLDDQLDRMGRSRHVGLVVPSFQLVPSVLFDTDYIALMPIHAIAPDVRERLALLPPPIPVEGFSVHLAWPSRANGDKALRHVVEFLSDYLARVVGETNKG